MGQKQIIAKGDNSAALAFWWVGCALFGASLLHRGLTFDFLHSGHSWSVGRSAQVFAIGALSDFWIATIAAFAAALTYASLRRWPRLALVVTIGMWFGWPMLALFFHHGYVSFFRVQILPHHLAYIFDRAFLDANQDAGLNWRAYTFLVCSMVACALAYKLARRLVAKTRMGRVAQVAGMVCLAIGIHALNIRWRVNYMLPDNLQVHTFEKLYISLRHLPRPTKLTAEEIQFLERGFSSSSTAANQMLDPPEIGASQGVLKAIEDAFHERHAAAEIPIVAVVMLESARPADFGVYAPASSKPDLTPVFTQLVRGGGVWFPRAYNTGSVTRAGQEAVLCGLPSAVGVSLMRERQDLDIDCLPRKLAGHVGTFWYHGGSGDFDSQESFWRRQNVTQILTQSAFSPDRPATSWGLSDLELFKRATKEFIELRHRAQYKAWFGMVLTITNHIPWDLPSDAPDSIRSMPVAHPSFATTAYVDWALGQWVTELRETKLWDNMVMILVSDHGARHPLYNDLYDSHVEENSVAHGVLALTGGIVEVATRRQAWTLDENVSQMDVAAWIGRLFRIQDSTPGHAALDRPRGRPLGVDLENRIFFPERNFVLSKTDVLSNSSLALPPENRLPVLYYRALMDWLLSQSAKHLAE